jgi:quercetin dioxygenase-like cupin family protein
MRITPDRSAATAPADASKFTGSVWRADYITPADADGLAGSRFLYGPGSRSFWHIHEHEQAIIAVFGSGLVSWQGLAVPQPLGAGDWWHVAPGVPHWHGATADSAFAHLAVTAGGATSWLHEVSEADYLAGAAG